MTEREAFEKWYTDSLCNPELSSFAHKVWQAACKYQREKDAAICNYITNYQISDHSSDCENAILNQGDE